MPGFYFDGFWPDFYTDSLEKDFIMSLFSDERCWETTSNICEYTVTSVFGIKNIFLNEKTKWVSLSFEPVNPYHDRQSLCIVTFKDNRDKIFYLPFGIFYMHLRGLLDKILNPVKVTKVPEKFCCFLSSSAYGLPAERKIMFEKLSEYKHVDSWGSHLNNTGKKLSCDYHSQEFLDFLSQYKFIIAFENKSIPGYFTEKIINPLVAGIVPIYWGTDDVNNVFNPERFIYVKDISSLEDTINKIKELDSDDQKYLDMVNRPNVIGNDNYLFDLLKIKKMIRESMV